MKNVRIHKPVPGLHTWGIEYNYSPEGRVSTDSDANDFVHAVNELRSKAPVNCWFHQCGSVTESHERGYRGYQFFEYWGPDAEQEVRKMALAVAGILGCKVVEPE